MRVVQFLIPIYYMIFSCLHEIGEIVEIYMKHSFKDDIMKTYGSISNIILIR
jgi:hypothetical protein